MLQHEAKMQCRDEEIFQRLSARAQDIVKDERLCRGCSWGGNMEETQTRLQLGLYPLVI